MKKPVPAKAQTGFLLLKTKGSGTSTAGLKSTTGHVLLAHGAGGHQDHPHMLDLAASLTQSGLIVHRFNFPYREHGRGFPDRMPVLTECFRAHGQRILKKEKPGFLILAGHSMGTRAALALAAEGFPCRGLILFSYPLHPPGHPEKPRLDHLDALRVPVLGLSGTNDAFCTPSLMNAMVKGLAGGKAGRGAVRKSKHQWTQHWIEGADHGLKVAKKSGRSRAEVLAEIEAACRDWLLGARLHA
ncbi:MAG: alpha/beta fold hydrolase [Fibrobacteria bacterium]